MVEKTWPSDQAGMVQRGLPRGDNLAESARPLGWALRPKLGGDGGGGWRVSCGLQLCAISDMCSGS